MAELAVGEKRNCVVLTWQPISRRDNRRKGIVRTGSIRPHACTQGGLFIPVSSATNYRQETFTVAAWPDLRLDMAMLSMKPQAHASSWIFWSIARRRAAISKAIEAVGLRSPVSISLCSAFAYGGTTGGVSPSGG